MEKSELTFLTKGKKLFMLGTKVPQTKIHLANGLEAMTQKWQTLLEAYIRTYLSIVSLFPICGIKSQSRPFHTKLKPNRCKTFPIIAKDNMSDLG